MGLPCSGNNLSDSLSPGEEHSEILQRQGCLLDSRFAHVSGMDASPAPGFLAFKFFSARGNS